MINAETLCGRTIRIKAKDVRSFYWGDNALCCGECRNILDARNAWAEVYA